MSRVPANVVFGIVVTEIRNGLFHSVLLRILYPEAILYLSLDPKTIDLGIPNPKLELFFYNNWKIMERSVVGVSNHH